MSAREVFGTRLRRRQMLGWTPHDLAERLGSGVGSSSRDAQGVYKDMTCARWRQMTTVLQTTADCLLGRSNEAGPLPDRGCPGNALRVAGMTRSLLPAFLV